MFTFRIKTTDGIGHRDIQAYNIEDCLHKVGFNNYKIGFIPYESRKKYTELEWTVTIPCHLAGHTSKYNVTILKH